MIQKRLLIRRSAWLSGRRTFWPPPQPAAKRMQPVASATPPGGRRERRRGGGAPVTTATRYPWAAGANATECDLTSAWLRSPRAPRARRPLGLERRASPARAGGRRRGGIRAARADAGAARTAGARTADRVVRARDRARARLARLARRPSRRGAVAHRAHGAAPAARRPGAARGRPRPQRPAAPTRARAAGRRQAPRARAPARRAAAVGAQPLRLAPAGALPGRARARCGARAPARALLRLRRLHVGGRGRAAAGTGVVRHRLEVPLRRRRAARRDDPRKRLHLVRASVLRAVRGGAAHVGPLGGGRPERRRSVDDGRGERRHARGARVAVPALGAGERAA